MQLTSIRFAIKLPLVIVTLCLLVTVTIATLAYVQSRATVTDQVDTRLNVLMYERAAKLKSWADIIERDVGSVSANRAVIEATEALIRSFRSIRENRFEELQRLYITDNPHPPGQRDLLDRGVDTASYHNMHARYHPYFRQLKNLNGYYDIFLFNSRGDLIYSVYKEDDYAHNFIDGPYADTGLGIVYRAAMAGEVGQIYTHDFAPYAPSHGAPAAFVATPLMDDFGQVIGVYAVQLPVGQISAILNDDPGLGVTGSIQAVGADGLALTEGRFEESIRILEPYTTPEGLAAYHAEDGHLMSVTTNAQGEPLLTAGVPAEVLDFTWFLIAEISQAEVMAPIIALRDKMAIIGAISLALCALLGWLASGMVTRPLSRLGHAMQAVSDRDQNVDIPDSDRRDEIGTLNQILLAFRDKLDATDRLEEAGRAKQAEQRRVVEQLSVGLTCLADGDLTRTIETPFAEEYETLRHDYNRTVDTLAGTIGTLISNSGAIQMRADSIADSSGDLSQRTENQAATLEETAAALDEMTASVRSAAGSAKEVEGIVNEARTDAVASEPVVRDAVAAMQEIEKSSAAISQIITVINDISFQTNLLALNAGVEAARAGDAGRGFAVVASEVRGLAQKSAEAAKEIKTLIDGSASEVERGVVLVGDAGAALERIVGRVAHISDVMGGMASSVKEQSTGLDEINIGVAQLDKVTQQNAAMVETTTASSRALDAAAHELVGLISRFKIPGGTDQAPAALPEFVPEPDIEQIPEQAPEQAPEPAPIPQAKPVVQTQADPDEGVWQDF